MPEIQIRDPWDCTPEERARTKAFLDATFADPKFWAEVDALYGEGPGEGDYAWKHIPYQGAQWADA